MITQICWPALRHLLLLLLFSLTTRSWMDPIPSNDGHPVTRSLPFKHVLLQLHVVISVWWIPTNHLIGNKQTVMQFILYVRSDISIIIIIINCGNPKSNKEFIIIIRQEPQSMCLTNSTPLNLSEWSVEISVVGMIKSSMRRSKHWTRIEEWIGRRRRSKVSTRQTNVSLCRLWASTFVSHSYVNGYWLSQHSWTIVDTFGVYLA